MRRLIAASPFADRRVEPAPPPWTPGTPWPCRWIADAAARPPAVVAYRRPFALEAATVVRVHVSADERYDLWLDGTCIGRGPERGDLAHWAFETYDLDLAAGDHNLVARVWSFGDLAPAAQVSAGHGFLCAPERPDLLDRLGTGVAPWQSRVLPGYGFVSAHVPNGFPMSVGPAVTIEGAGVAWGVETGEGDGWNRAVAVAPAYDAAAPFPADGTRLLTPAALPPMRDDPFRPVAVRHVGPAPGRDDAPYRAADDSPAAREAWTALTAHDAPLTLPPGLGRRVLLDLGELRCAYPEIVVTGGRGGEVALRWAEALVEEATPGTRAKGNRDAIEGKRLLAVGDRFRLDGGAGRRFDTPWWRVGRYLEVTTRAGDAPITIERLALRETGYPLDWPAAPATGDAGWDRLLAVCHRTLRACAHETFVDCPYYEQLQYAADARVEALVTYVTCPDDRLPVKALRLFDASRRNPTGFTLDAYPSRDRVVIPGFSLWWVAMVHDQARWRDDLALIAELMPGVRAVVDRFLACRGEDGLPRNPLGWNFVDWADEWRAGVPPGGEAGEVSGAATWHLVLTLKLAADLERIVGEPELAARAERLAAEIARLATAVFWRPARNLFADEPAGDRFSEQTQCLALLSGALDPAREAAVGDALFGATGLVPVSAFFAHYLFEVCHRLGRADVLARRLAPWFGALEEGLTTCPETFGGTRSDCHAWSAHPLFHWYATVLGVRPAAPRFAAVRIAPGLGRLPRAAGALPHPRGTIAVDFAVENGTLRGSVDLPRGVTGDLTWRGRRVALTAGRQTVAVTSP